jgi:hypothetical protein
MNYFGTTVTITDTHADTGYNTPITITYADTENDAYWQTFLNDLLSLTGTDVNHVTTSRMTVANADIGSSTFTLGWLPLVYLGPMPTFIEIYLKANV